MTPPVPRPVLLPIFQLGIESTPGPTHLPGLLTQSLCQCLDPLGLVPWFPSH